MLAELATDADDTRAETPELRLLSALLWQALADATKGHADAIAWLASDESASSATGWSYVAVCEGLGLDPAWGRQQGAQRGVRPRGGRRAGRRWRKLEAAA